MLAFLDRVHFKNRVEISPECQNSASQTSQITNTLTITGKFSINYEMTTLKSSYDATAPMETQLYLSLVISFKSLYSLNIFPR